MKKPFFSIVIPTYNRAKDLQRAISICLRQSFGDFELIVSDNASSDQTEEIVKSFKDIRIKYFKNKKNIGAANNFQKSFSYARGEYIFSMGDDDFILFEDTLEKIKKILDKKRWGFVRVNLLEKTLDGLGLRKSFITTEKNFSLESQSPAEKIFEFFTRTAASHLAGLVIKNKKNLSSEFMDCHDSPWIKPLYEAVKDSGAFFLASKYMVITWARVGEQTGVSSYYDVPQNNRLVFENYTDFVFKQISVQKLVDFKYNFYCNFVMLQPAIKLYSNNNNLIKFDRRLLILEPRLKRNPLFWLMATAAFIMPKLIWNRVRTIQHRQKNSLDRIKNINIIKQRFNYLNEANFA